MPRGKGRGAGEGIMAQEVERREGGLKDPWDFFSGVLQVEDTASSQAPWQGGGGAGGGWRGQSRRNTKWSRAVFF